MDKFTNMFQMALADAQSLAVGRDNQFIEPVHLFKALLSQNQGSIRPLLEQSGANLTVLAAELNKAIERLPQVEGAAGDVHVSNELGRLLNVADKIAQKRGDKFISCEIFVLASFEAKGLLQDI